MVETQSSHSVPEPPLSALPTETATAASDTFVRRRSGEEAVRRAAQAVSDRRAATKTAGSADDSTEKRSRRRSRRARSTPILGGTGLHFHYGIGLLLLMATIIVAFSEKISKKLWSVFHSAVPAGESPVEPAPWWFRVEIPVLVLGIGIWLYLTPGVWDRAKNTLGLRKDKERLSRRRFKKP